MEARAATTASRSMKKGGFNEASRRREEEEDEAEDVKRDGLDELRALRIPAYRRWCWIRVLCSDGSAPMSTYIHTKQR